MENSVKTIVPNVGTVLKTLGALIVIFAILDLAGYTGALISPVTFLKGKFGKSS